MSDSKEEIAVDPSFWSKTSLLQLWYGVWVNLTVIQIGMVFAFSAVLIPQLNSEDSFIQTTISDKSWIVSCIFLSSLVGCLASGFIVDRIGRRLVLVICQIPLFFGWLYTGLASTPKELIIGRIITGLGSGMVISVPRVYMTEMTLPNMRGLIGAFPNIANALGLLVQAELGFYVNCYVICHICALYSIILMIANSFLPETPYFLIVKGTAESARSTLKRIRANDYDIDSELEELQDFKDANNIHKLSVKEQLNMIFKRSSCVPFAIVNMYIFLMQLSGVSILILWAIEMIQDSKSSVDPYLANIILSISRVLSAIMAAFLFFKYGRRPLALLSSIGVAVTAFAIGIFIHIAEEPSIFPVICYVGYMMFATMGYYVLPFLIMYELFPLQVRGLLGGISIAIFFLIVFCTNFTHVPIRMALGHANTMILFGLFSSICAVFLFFCLPETKYLTLSEIEEYFNARRPTLAARRHTVDESVFSQRQSFMRPLQIAKSIQDTVKSAINLKAKSNNDIRSSQSENDVRKKFKKDDDEDFDKNKKRKVDEAGPSSRK